MLVEPEKFLKARGGDLPVRTISSSKALNKLWKWPGPCHFLLNGITSGFQNACLLYDTPALGIDHSQICLASTRLSLEHVLRLQSVAY